MKKLYSAVLAVYLWLFHAPVVMALGLVNGDFSDGFNGWSGAVVQDIGGQAVLTPVNPANDPLHFSLSPGEGARLINDDIFYLVVLFQQFDVTPDTRYVLDFKYTWIPTDPYYDQFQASVSFWDGQQFGFPVNLFSTPAVPYVDPPFSGVYTSPATGRLRVDFILADNDYLTPDTLQIQNVTTTSSVPEPGTALLVASGMLALIPFLRRNRL